MDFEWRRDKTKTFAILVREYKLGASGNELRNDYRDNLWRYCELYPGVKSTLESLRASSFQLAIVSNGTSHCQDAKIVGLGLDKLVDITLISEAEGVRKPAPQLFLRAVQRLQVSPDQCFVVGDSTADDIVGGNAAGMKTIWLEQQGRWPAGISVRPHFIVPSVADIPGLMP